MNQATSTNREMPRRWRVVYEDAEIAFHYGEPKVGDTIALDGVPYAVLRVADGDDYQRCVIVGDTSPR